MFVLVVGTAIWLVSGRKTDLWGGYVCTSCERNFDDEICCRECCSEVICLLSYLSFISTSSSKLEFSFKYVILKLSNVYLLDRNVYNLFNISTNFICFLSTYLSSYQQKEIPQLSLLTLKLCSLHTFT